MLARPASFLRTVVETVERGGARAPSGTSVGPSFLAGAPQRPPSTLGNTTRHNYFYSPRSLLLLLLSRPRLPLLLPSSSRHLLPAGLSYEEGEVHSVSVFGGGVVEVGQGLEMRERRERGEREKRVSERGDGMRVLTARASFYKAPPPRSQFASPAGRSLELTGGSLVALWLTPCSAVRTKPLPHQK